MFDAAKGNCKFLYIILINFIVLSINYIALFILIVIMDILSQLYILYMSQYGLYEAIISSIGFLSIIGM